MKKIIFILVCALISATSVLHAQYVVTKVSGRIKTGAGSYIRPGSAINETDILIFSSTKDKVWLIIPGKGEKMVTPSSQAQAVDNGISQLLSDATMSDIATVSLRAGVSIIENIPAAVVPEDEKSGKVIIEQENKFLFDTAQYPQGDNGGTFFLQIDAASVKPVTHRLQSNGDTLVILYKDFLSESIDPYKRYELNYYSFRTNSGQVVAVINPYFDLTNEMEDIIANTVKTYKGQNMTVDSLKLKAYNNVYSFTGKPNGILFSTLFDKYWQGLDLSDTLNEGRHRARGNNFEETDFLAVPVLSGSVTASRAALPPNCSLRQYAPPVGDQKDYNTCSAWASAYATRTIAFAVSHNYTVNNDYEKIISNTFSPDFVYNNVQPSGDCNQTSSLKKSLNFIADKGVLLKKGTSFACGASYIINDFDSAKNYRIKDFQRINNPATDSEASLVFKIKTLLANKNAIAFGMVTPDSFLGIQKSGEWLPTDADYKNIDSVNRKLLGHHDGHAMCVIGYNDDVSGGSFEIMNSWGPSAGNSGFYWINYHDFFLFAYEMYTVSDFGPTSTSDVATPAVNTSGTNKATAQTATPATATSVTVQSQSPVAISTPGEATSVINTIDNSLRLKGEMELMLQKPDRSYEGIDVSERIINTTGQIVDLNPLSANYNYASFNVSKPLYSGNRYKIKFTLSQAAYIYVISKDDRNNYSRLFPQKDMNESPLINFTNATLYLPNERQNYKLDEVPGKEKMCVLLSKSPIDIKSLDQQVAIADNNMYQIISTSLVDRLIDIKNIKFTNNDRILFDSEVTENKVLAFFIEMDHL